MSGHVSVRDVGEGVLFCGEVMERGAWLAMCGIGDRCVY